MLVSTGIYIRVSTEEQAREGYSIRAQEEKLRAYATIKDWHVYGIYADEGISGKDIDGRPEIKRLIADVTSGKVNNVLVYKIDRLTRSTKNLIELVELFNQNKCDFNSLNESIDTGSATGRMFLKIVGIFAEFERENLAERLRFGFERKAKEGYSLATYRQAYGYNREIGDKIQGIVDEEAKTVRRIFDLYLHDDYNLTEIARILNSEGVPTKMGKSWKSVTVKLVLENSTYTGKVRYSMGDATRYFEANGRHEPIIDEDTFFQVQDKINKITRIAHTKRPSSGVYFCGVLYCPICGDKYATKWNYKHKNDNGGSIKYASYRCPNALYGDCKAKNISQIKLEQAFLEYISLIDDLIADEIEQPHAAAKSDHSAEIAVITNKIEQIDNKTKEITKLFMSDSLDFSEYQNMVKIGNEQRTELEAQLNILKRKQDTKTVRYTTTEIAANFRDNWQVLDNKQRQQFIQKFIKKIVANSIPPRFGRTNDVVINEIYFNDF